jgi:circadian clock protein KaiC
MGRSAFPGKQIEKCPTGISGLDSILGGGLPRGRTSLIGGTAGSGKTMLGLEFLVRGATEFGEPGLLVAFEEHPSDIAANMASLGWDIDRLQAEGKLAIESLVVKDAEMDEGVHGISYLFAHLFARLEFAIEDLGAKRVVLDSLEVPLARLKDLVTVSSEMQRLCRWLRDKGITTIVTGRRGSSPHKLDGIEEYVSDCVISLDNRFINGVPSRQFRVLKYRGAGHKINEVPFVIDDHGFTTLPLGDLELDHEVSTDRFFTGIDDLDDMLGKGVYRGNNFLISGKAGTGKTSIGASMAEAACKRGERVLMVLLEESPNQVIRNLRSIGVDLEPWRKQGLLRMKAARPLTHTPERLLIDCVNSVLEFDPRLVVVDPINSMVQPGLSGKSCPLMMRLVDTLKSRMVTSVFLDLSNEDSDTMPVTGVSSLIDTWMKVTTIERFGRRDPVIAIIKSRGTAHSRQDREFCFTSQGLQFVILNEGPAEMRTGQAGTDRGPSSHEDPVL